MSFTFGALDSDALTWAATLRRLPSLAGLQLETLEAPGADGLILGGATLSKAQYVFDVIIKGSTVTDAAARRDAFVQALDPARGEQALSFDAAPGWTWQAILSGAIDWERLTWDAAAGFTFRADVTFDALAGYGRLAVDETWALPGAGSMQVTRAKGNARSFPAVEVDVAATFTGPVTVEAGGVQVVVTGRFEAGETLRMDWDRFDFARWDGPTKVASVVRGMSTLDRPEMWPGVASTFKVATAGTVSAARLYANSRRL